MPELPEVQTMVNDLKKAIIGRKITGVWIGAPALIKQPTAEKFKKEIMGRKLLSVGRRGKNILIELDRDFILLIHPKMTGHFLLGRFRIQGRGRNETVVGEINEERNKKDLSYIRLIFYLENGEGLGLSDVRKFAKVILFKKSEAAKFLGSLGIDALEIKYPEFEALVRKNKKPAKPFLMDQSRIAGVGNIYADEILYAAKVHPLQETSRLSRERIKAVFSAMKEILNKAVRLRGTSVSDFRDIAGREGDYAPRCAVYGREGEFCPKGDTRIKRITIAGRSSYFCPVEQKLSS
jgi:formamidopyrimidine-DNA glycosylase